MSQYAQEDSVVLLNAVTGTGSSAWIPSEEFYSKNLDIRISATATVKIMVSNEPSQPDSSADGPQSGSDVTATSVVTFTYPVKWVKVKVSAISGGNVSVFFYGRTFRNTRITH